MSVPRLVLFVGSVPDEGALRFMRSLADRTDLDLAGVYCEGRVLGLRERMEDLWRRRGILAPIVASVAAVQATASFLSAPAGHAERRRLVRELSGRIEPVADLHGADFLAKLRALAPDLGLVYGGPILRPALFTIPRLGTLGIHHGEVPAYRGKKTTFWAMYNGERAVGVTIQRINAGLDTGEIVKQASVPVNGRSLSAVWRDLEAVGIDLFVEAVEDVVRGSATYRPQGGSRGRLYRDPGLLDLTRYAVRRIRRRWGRAAVSSGPARVKTRKLGAGESSNGSRNGPAGNPRGT